MLVCAAVIGCSGPAGAVDDYAPMGRAEQLERSYPEIDTVLDVSYDDPRDLNLLYGFVRSLRQSLPGGETIVVLHGPELRAFAVENYATYQGEMLRMAELAEEGTLFHMCGDALTAAGYEPEDMHGFVTVVPNAFAEIAFLQKQGHELLVPLPRDVSNVRDLEEGFP